MPKYISHVGLGIFTPLSFLESEAFNDADTNAGSDLDTKGDKTALSDSLRGGDNNQDLFTVWIKAASTITLLPGDEDKKE